MPKLKVFVSSTCFDLSSVRTELYSFIEQMGHEPVMSEFGDILFDPSMHTHESCAQAVQYCDVIVMIIGSRFGGKAIPESLSKIASDAEDSDIVEYIEKCRGRVSVTQLEVLTAIKSNLPVYTFVDDKVLNYHHLYEKNKTKQSVINEIVFPGFDGAETAKYIFEFFNFLRQRSVDNSYKSFSSLSDIRDDLRGQWSQLFQRLLELQRRQTSAEKKAAQISEQLEDLKYAILSSIESPGGKEIAKATLRFRLLVQFMSQLGTDKLVAKRIKSIPFGDLLKRAGVSNTTTVRSEDEFSRTIVLFEMKDGSYRQLRQGPRLLETCELLWNEFKFLDEETRRAVVEGVGESDLRARYLIPVSKEDFSQPADLFIGDEEN
jgi:hypothetical protein